MTGTRNIGFSTPPSNPEPGLIRLLGIITALTGAGIMVAAALSAYLNGVTPLTLEWL